MQTFSSALMGEDCEQGVGLFKVLDCETKGVGLFDGPPESPVDYVAKFW